MKNSTSHTSSADAQTQVIRAGVALLGAAIGAKLSNDLIEDRGLVGFLAGAAGAILGGVAGKHLGDSYIQDHSEDQDR